ncbi:putative transporter [Ceratocystis lukuohia]|uniref:Transporter n=1 Tax=Ceratocystis lukuohia TaxID=2019550 RepID=A0ABR4MQT2_9PEZI
MSSGSQEKEAKDVKLSALKPPLASSAAKETTASSSTGPGSPSGPSSSHSKKDEDGEYIRRIATGDRTDSNASLTADGANRTEAEKALVRKLDLRIMPAICLAWMLFYLDRAAIGFALTNGLVRELRLHGVQINVMMMLYYVPFIILSIPGNLILRRVGAGRMISIVVISWGVVTTCTGFVKSYGALCVMRILMGITESFFLGGVMLYLGFFYRANELTARTGIFYSSTSISAAIGGLLASGLGEIKTGKYIGWSWIFFIEGIITVLIGIGSWIILPIRPETCNFLSPSERQLALTRMKEADMKYQSRGSGSADVAESGRISDNNSSQTGTGTFHHITKLDQKVADGVQHDRLEWPVVKRALLNPLTPMMALSCFFNIEGLSSYIMFLPTIVSVIVGDGSRLKANLLTVPPNIAAFIATIAITQWSQRWGRSGIPIIFCGSMAALGYTLLLIGSETRGPYQIVPSVQYVGTFFVGMGVSALPPIALAWVSVNTAPHYVRALVLGFVIAIGNTASFLSSFTYLSKEAPK